MNTPLDSFDLWRKTLAPQNDSDEPARERLRQSFLSFRDRVAQLVASIGSELPGLTVHDITHLDALWRVTYQISGESYPLNPAEAYILGGAFLLHDAAHVLAAYPGGLKEIKSTVHWQDLIAQRFGRLEPQQNSDAEKSAIFQVLRNLHADQAHKLPSIPWKIPGSDDPIYLIESLELRQYFGLLIGEIAASHHWSAEKVVAIFKDWIVPCPAFLSPACWEVDALKIALLLRTADAAHLDDGRAPWFLFALRQPQGVSATHWHFQAKIGQPTRTDSGELRISSGASFGPHERGAWWLAFDTARMVDRELRSAYDILKEEGRPLFAATSVLGVESPQAFQRQVRVNGWIPIDVAPKVGDVSQLIASLGGSALYGENKAAPLREILQNALDAVGAMRALGGIGADEGTVEVEIQPTNDGHWWLTVTDPGVGMSRYVLTNVLLDFGASLWKMDSLRDEWSGLARSEFAPVGKFGIGFFSIFMLGDEVRVTTRRFEARGEAEGLHWELRFEKGLIARPTLMEPLQADKLKRPGTRVAVKVSDARLKLLLPDVKVRYKSTENFDGLNEIFADLFPKKPTSDEERANSFAWLVAFLCPTSPVKLSTRFGSHNGFFSVNGGDWKSIDDSILLARSRCEKALILPLNDVTGRTMGRVGLASDSYHSGEASLVYQGVLCGKAPGLAGICEAAQNNLDARRESAKPGGNLAAWADWAKRLLDCAAGLSLAQTLQLHPLIPELDLAVWRFQGEIMTMKILVTRVIDFDEIMLHQGDIFHDDDDDVTLARFSSSFTAGNNLICMPDFSWGDSFSDPIEENGRYFPWSVGAKAIDYRSRLLAAIHETGSEMSEVDETAYVVGEVDGAEIVRRAVKYKRSTPD
jgi:hypothetical protein